MKIGLQNFQGVGAYTEIPIAPITLFYGPNSAGKSTVADAFQFLRETLSGQNEGWQKDLEKHARRNRKERPLSAGHRGDPHDVVFTIEGSPYTKSFSLSHSGDEFFEKLLFDQKYFDGFQWLGAHPGIEQTFKEGKKFQYQIQFSNNNESGKWQLRESLLTIDDLPLFKTQTHDRYDDLEIAFNIRHPAYLQLEKLDELIRWWFVEWAVEEYLDEEVVNERLCWLKISGISIGGPFSLSPIDWYANDWHVILEDVDDKVAAQFRILSEYLDFFMVMPAKWASESCQLHSVPPLRTLPENKAVLEVRVNSRSPNNLVNIIEAVFAANARGVPSEWCWDTLADDIRKEKIVENDEAVDKHALTFINNVLISRDFLDTGYAIEGDVKFKFLLDKDELSNLIQLDPSSRQQRLLETPAIVHLYLLYQPENFPVEIADVGVGISQVIPVLFGCWQAMTGRNSVHIQQPELHLHPKLQAQLADVFVKCINTSEDCGIFLLESHSEHLLLRLLRRIRETNQTENSTSNVLDIGKARSRSLNAEQVSVVYVKKDENGLTTMKHLRLAEDGEFLDRWPDGFFSERDKELFGDEEPFA